MSLEFFDTLVVCWKHDSRGNGVFFKGLQQKLVKKKCLLPKAIFFVILFFPNKFLKFMKMCDDKNLYDIFR
jgi:hypothetical protein